MFARMAKGKIPSLAHNGGWKEGSLAAHSPSHAPSGRTDGRPHACDDGARVRLHLEPRARDENGIYDRHDSGAAGGGGG